MGEWQIYTGLGVITEQELQDWVQKLENWGQNPLGPKLVARAWVDPDFKARLLEDGQAAAAEVDAHVAMFKPRGGVSGDILHLHIAFMGQAV